MRVVKGTRSASHRATLLWPASVSHAHGARVQGAQAYRRERRVDRDQRREDRDLRASDGGDAVRARLGQHQLGQFINPDPDDAESTNTLAQQPDLGEGLGGDEMGDGAAFSF